MGALDRFVDDFHAHYTQDPNACLSLGVQKRTGELPDPSLEAGRALACEAQALLRQAWALDTAELGFEQQLDLELATRRLQGEVHQETLTFNGRTTRQQMPVAGVDIGDGLFNLFVNDPRPDGDRLRDVQSRLERVPGYLAAAFRRLESPVARWVEMEQERLAGLPDLFETLVAWADRVAYPDEAALRRSVAEALVALDAYGRRLAALPTVRNFHVGEAHARQIVALRGIDLSLEALHAMARRFLQENGATLDALHGRLARKYGLSPGTGVSQLHEHLLQRFQVQRPSGALEDVLDRYRSELGRIADFVAARDLFPIPDDQEMKIIRTPSFMAPSIPAGAMMPPPPFREGVKTSLVYLTLSEELLAEHTELNIPSMMIHEGIPGHHLQLSWAAAHPSIIRRHVEAMDHAEGWTTMLEDYMLDMGYMGDLADETRFCSKRDVARLGARVAIDLFFMTGDRSYLDVGVDCDLSHDDPFAAAGELLRTVTGFVPGRVRAELNWYSTERGYPLSYLTGNQMVWQLKRDLQAAQRGRAEGLELDRLFHRTYLESGNMPVSALRRVFEHRGLL